MTQKEFMAVLERKPIGYICPFCNNIVRITKTNSLKQFLRFNTIEKCKKCDSSQKDYSVFFFGYKYLDKFVFSFSFPDEPEREPEECFVDFDNTVLCESDTGSDRLDIKLKKIADPDVKITFVLKK